MKRWQGHQSDNPAVPIGFRAKPHQADLAVEHQMLQRELGVVRPTIGFVRLGYFDSRKPYRSSVGKPHGPAIRHRLHLAGAEYPRRAGRLVLRPRHGREQYRHPRARARRYLSD